MPQAASAREHPAAHRVRESSRFPWLHHAGASSRPRRSVLGPSEAEGNPQGQPTHRRRSPVCLSDALDHERGPPDR